MSSIPVHSSPLSQTPIKELQPTTTCLLTININQLPGYPLHHGPESEAGPEPSSQREPLYVLPYNIENSVFNLCTNNNDNLSS